MKTRLILIQLCALFVTSKLALAGGTNEFVCIVRSFNTEKWYQKNLDSMLNQTNQHCKIIYIDDCSKDKTKACVLSYLRQKNIETRVIRIDYSKFSQPRDAERIVEFLKSKQCGKAKFTYIENSVNQGGTFNYYMSIHTCNDRAIIVSVDGDDWLYSPDVLSIVDNTYKKNHPLLTYGNYIQTSGNQYHRLGRFPAHIIATNRFRKYGFLSTHLKTFRAGLFKKIRVEDLQYRDSFIKAATDQAIMFPMLEMAGDRIINIDRPLYVYNDNHELNVGKTRPGLSATMRDIVSKKPPYQKVNFADY